MYLKESILPKVPRTHGRLYVWGGPKIRVLPIQNISEAIRVAKA